MRTLVALFASVLLLTGIQDADQTRQERNERLQFMVGEWSTVHEVPGRDGGVTTFAGEASIDRAVGGTYVRHEWHASMEGRGDFFMMLMMNWSPEKEMYNCCLFDKAGGEPGLFYGDWTDDDTLLVKAQFKDDDGGADHQRFTFVSVSASEFTLSRAFSDDGEHYHFEVKGTYTRKKGDGAAKART